MATSEQVRVWEDSMVIPTSVEGPPDLNPPFDLFNTGRFHNYPYTLRHNLTDRLVPRRWRTLNLENEYLQCTMLPDLGGHLYDCFDKIAGASAFYANSSLKFARLAYRGAWAACGVEFNFPVSHNWMTVSPVDFAIRREPDGGASVWVGNIDRVYGMQWHVRLTLHPGCAYLEQTNNIYNRGQTRHRFYWWTNAAVEVWDDSRILYPMEFTAGHAFADVDTWPVNLVGVDLSVIGNHKYGPVSRFSYGSQEPYMAVYHPRTQAGIVHYSLPTDLPAKKIWSWGCDEDGIDWRNALSDNDSAYVEIQAGLFPDQETYGFLEPQESRTFSEYWIPIRRLGGVSRANLNAVLNLNRREQSLPAALDIALNVTREFRDASIRILADECEVASRRASLSPSETFRESFAGLRPSAPYTVEVRDQSGEILLQHTEGKYDFESRDTIQTGPQPPRKSAEEPGSIEEILAKATDQESNGQQLSAIKTYERGLAQFPDSLALNRAAGRLEVALKRYGSAVQHLSKVTAEDKDDEAAYYLGLALAAEDREQEARIQWESALQSKEYGVPAGLELAALAARRGDRDLALKILRGLAESGQDLVEAGELEIALLRACGHEDEARARLTSWIQQAPTCSFLRYENVKLGANDPSLISHLAADPERILEIAVAYMRVGLFADAVELLAQPYPSGSEVVSEPGMPHPGSHPLIAYYRGFCREACRQDGRVDFNAGSRMPTRYVFPNRAESLRVLRRAVEVNREDATARFLLGSLYLSGGIIQQAMEQWETVRRIQPDIPTLHRDMGYTVLRSGGPPERAIELFREGAKYDSGNADVFLGLEEAMEKAGRPISERIEALLGFADTQSAPTAFVFKLAQLLSEIGEFDEAEELLANRFFVKEEGGVDVRQVYVTVKLRRAKTMAMEGKCDSALNIVRQLGESVPEFSFTASGMGPHVNSESAKKIIEEIERMCSIVPAPGNSS